jgi:hypothetical protein
MYAMQVSSSIAVTHVALPSRRNSVRQAMRSARPSANRVRLPNEVRVYPSPGVRVSKSGCVGVQVRMCGCPIPGVRVCGCPSPGLRGSNSGCAGVRCISAKHGGCALMYATWVSPYFVTVSDSISVTRYCRASQTTHRILLNYRLQ